MQVSIHDDIYYRLKLKKKGIEIEATGKDPLDRDQF